ncbi:MAG: M20/M25/M40 family metallo-hydrolase [Oligoflexia bacterium]|nr:M20/M25/M40 family metallo-hydrolase [Oligoflexia bacterium]
MSNFKLNSFKLFQLTIVFLLTFFLLNIGLYAKTTTRSATATATVTAVHSEEIWVTLTNDLYKIAQGHIPIIHKEENSKNGLILIKINSDYLDTLSYLKHQNPGTQGFVSHYNVKEAREYLNKENINEVQLNVPLFVDYTLTKETLVNRFIDEVLEQNIIDTIKTLSDFFNRHYRSQTGVESSQWIKNKWITLTKGRADITVAEFRHQFNQPSIVLTIKGKDKPEEMLVVGGHFDSTAGYFGGASNRAPGADDNASGISVITETLRVLMANNYQPSRTVMFVAYAAEEAGLLGSKDIANDCKNKRLNIVGVMQLDMTNYKGSEKDIYLISDNTNARQNEFVGTLIDKYVKVSWGQSACGYGCSDHASWNTNGYPASLPFESKSEEYNPKIHSSGDLLSVTNNRAEHSVKFAKLAIAYVLELAK